MWFARKWVELEIMMAHEINQTQKDKYCRFFSHVRSRDLGEMT